VIGIVDSGDMIRGRGGEIMSWVKGRHGGARIRDEVDSSEGNVVSINNGHWTPFCQALWSVRTSNQLQDTNSNRDSQRE